MPNVFVPAIELDLEIFSLGRFAYLKNLQITLFGGYFHIWR